MAYTYNRTARVDLRQQMHQPSQADEALGAAYVKLVSFKQGLDEMEEIPAYLQPYYKQVMKAMDVVGEARKETYQLRMMTQRLHF
jgi:hypothetical protein